MSFDDIISASENVKERAKSAVEGRLTTALFVLCLTASIVLSFVETGVINPFSLELWVGLANRFLTTYVTFILFISPGERDEIARNERHRAAEALLEELSTGIYNNNLLTAFYAFCETKEKENAEKKRRHIYSRYLTQTAYDGLQGIKHAKAEYKAGRLTKEQYKAYMAAYKVKPKHIKPAYILSCCPFDKTEEAGTDVMSYARKSILSKPVTFIIMSICLNSVTLTWTGTSLADVIVGIATSGVLIFCSALSGYKVGQNSAEWNTSQRHLSIRFIKEFHERHTQTEV